LYIHPKFTLVISAINFSEGGPLTVLRECVKASSEALSGNWQVIALVHDKRLFEAAAGVTFIEFPLAKRSWLMRLYYEWFHFYKLSKRLKPDLWLSLHDITPRVVARRQAVYCHNPAPFFSVSMRDALLDPKLFLFNRFYKRLYAWGISRNRHVIVQQSWLRSEFQRSFGLKEVVVAYPEMKPGTMSCMSEQAIKTGNKVFFYPALPRVPKNLDIIFEAVGLLNSQGVGGFEVRLTICGNENRYARMLLMKYSDVTNIVLVGRQNQSQMAEQYKNCDCLLFPSRLETWGLPISESKVYGLPLLVADLPYAHETVGTYDRVRFFNPLDAGELAAMMKSYIDGDLNFESVREFTPDHPFVDSWPGLIRLLVMGLDTVEPLNGSNNGQADVSDPPQVLKRIMS
jgi:glycosyltransferase involved in cell wall biosynthesis